VILSCKESEALSEDEKSVFEAHLAELGISRNVWDIFEQWVGRSTPEVRFFYLKVYDGADLAGVGLFLRLKPYDIRSSFLKLRTNPVLSLLARGFSALTRNCVYTTFQILVTSNLARPFFFKDPRQQVQVLAAMLDHLKRLPDADSVSLIDHASNAPIFEKEGYDAYPSPSLSWIDATKYSNVSEYLSQHRNLKRNLARKRTNDSVTTEVRQGVLSKTELEELQACVQCSIGNTKVYMPCQTFFERNVFTSKAYTSDDYIHVLVRIHGKVAGFHTFQRSGSHLGGVLGGFNRENNHHHFVYEKVMVAILGHAIDNRFQRVYFSIIDNHTKLRLVTDTEPCKLYFHSRNPGNRNFFQKTFQHSDVNSLHLLETAKDAAS